MQLTAETQYQPVKRDDELERIGGEKAENLTPDEVTLLFKQGELLLGPDGKMIKPKDNNLRLELAMRRLSLPGRSNTERRSFLRQLKDIADPTKIKHFLIGEKAGSKQKAQYIPTEEQVSNPFTQYFKPELYREILERTIPADSGFSPGSSLEMIFLTNRQKEIDALVERAIHEAREYRAYYSRSAIYEGLPKKKEAENLENFLALSQDPTVKIIDVDRLGNPDNYHPLTLYTDENETVLKFGDGANYIDAGDNQGFMVRNKTRYFIKGNEVYVARYLPRFTSEDDDIATVNISPSPMYPHLDYLRRVRVFKEVPDTVQIVVYFLKTSPRELDNVLKIQATLEQTSELLRQLTGANGNNDTA